MYLGDESDDEPISTDMLEDIQDGSQSRTSVNRRDARYKIRDHIKRGQVEWKGALLSTRNICDRLQDSVWKREFCMTRLY